MTDKGNRIATFVRIPLYRNYLVSLDPMPEYISASVIAQALRFGEVQVRKDLALVCGGGRPRVGYLTTDLLARLETALSYRETGNAVLVGAGNLGHALLDYTGFKNYGVELVAGFDARPESIGETKAGRKIYPMEKLTEFCMNNPISIGILTVPSNQAQKVADELIACGVRAIWCFSPVRLDVPAGVAVRYENLAASLAALAARLEDTATAIENSHI